MRKERGCHCIERVAPPRAAKQPRVLVAIAACNSHAWRQLLEMKEGQDRLKPVWSMVYSAHAGFFFVNSMFACGGLLFCVGPFRLRRSTLSVQSTIKNVVGSFQKKRPHPLAGEASCAGWQRCQVSTSSCTSPSRRGRVSINTTVLIMVWTLPGLQGVAYVSAANQFVATSTTFCSSAALLTHPSTPAHKRHVKNSTLVQARNGD